MDNLVCKVFEERKAKLVLLGFLDCWDHRVLQEHLVFQVPLDLGDHRVCLEKLASQENLDILDRQGHQERMG